MRLKLDNIPSEVLNGSQKLLFYTWNESCDLAKNYSTRPKNFAFQFVRNGAGSFYPNDENLDNGTINIDSANNSFTELNASTINKVTKHFLSQPSEFKDHFFIVFTDLANEDQAMMLGMFPSSGGAANSRVEFLLPPYWADPNVYENTHTHNDIIRLHPLYRDKNKYSNYNEFYSEMLDYCSNMQVN